MKRLYVTAVIAGAMFLAVGPVNAQVYENSQAEAEMEQPQKIKYAQIEAQDLPQQVREAFEKDYQGSTLTEIYSAEKDGETSYKLIVSSEDGKTLELFADAQGNWIQKDEKNQK